MDFFRLLETIELHFQVEAMQVPIRVELLQNSANANLFKARYWLYDSYRVEQALTPGETVNVGIYVDWSTSVDGSDRTFEAANSEEALQRSMESIQSLFRD